jgi:hypothetical protein
VREQIVDEPTHRYVGGAERKPRIGAAGQKVFEDAHEPSSLDSRHAEQRASLRLARSCNRRDRSHDVEAARGSGSIGRLGFHHLSILPCIRGLSQSPPKTLETVMALMSTRTWNDWIAEYSLSHQHPANRFCHSIGIPMIAASVLLAPLALVSKLGWVPLALFVVGWIFQFVGHAFERKAPEFLKDWRFLFVGLRWWFAKIAGRA